MSKQDVRKEQVALLRFEKQLSEMADTLANGSAVASSTDAKLGSTEATAAYDEMKAALLNLAEVTSRAHDSLMNKAVESGRRFVDFNGHKGNNREAVRSALSSS